MREIAFIKQNKEKWLNIEQQLTIKNKISADNWSNMYVQLSNDLAFAQTYFHGSKADLKIGDLIVPGYNSNFGRRINAKYIFISCTFNYLRQCLRSGFEPESRPSI